MKSHLGLAFVYDLTSKCVLAAGEICTAKNSLSHRPPRLTHIAAQLVLACAPWQHELQQAAARLPVKLIHQQGVMSWLKMISNFLK